MKGHASAGAAAAAAGAQAAAGRPVAAAAAAAAARRPWPGVAAPDSDLTTCKMSQCKNCLALFHTSKNAKVHLRHSTKCLRRVSEIAGRKRLETGNFLPIYSVGII